MFYSKRLVSCSFLLALLATGCGSEQHAGPEGVWSLHPQEFQDQAVRVLVDEGRIPAEAEGLARAQLEKVHLRLELQRDGKFTADMGAAVERHRYTGPSTLTGTHIQLDQTHEDGEPVTDQMTGTLQDGAMNLIHMEEGLAMPYVLRQDSVAAPSR